MENNIKFNYQKTKDQQRPSRYEQEGVNMVMQNGLDMKKIVQNYQFFLVNILSRNQNSQIYHGIDKNTQHPVAIKVIPISKTPTDRQRQQLQNQIKFCKYFGRHKNIIEVYNYFSTANNHYIMMEKAQEDLKSLLLRKKVLTEEEVIGVMVDILEAMKVMYTKGCIHCNIKPSNVLICPQGAKLTDFGLTQKFNHESKNSFEPHQWTPYMNHLTLVTRSYDQNNDVWALAVMVYECLHGYHNYPWKFQTYSDLLQKIYDLNIQYNRKVSKETAEFLTKVLNPSNKLSVLDLYNQPFVQRCIQKRKENFWKGLEDVNGNGVSPIKYQSQKFGNFSADIADQVTNRVQKRSSNQQLIPHNSLLPLRKHVSSRQPFPHIQNFISEKAPQTRNFHPRQIIDCQLSFMRFLNIILKQDQHGYIAEKSPNTVDPKHLEWFQKKDIDHKLFRFVIIKQMFSQKHCLNKTIDPYNSQNPFHIHGLQQFMSTQEGKQLSKNVRNKLKQYDAKYQPWQKEMNQLIEELGKRIIKKRPQGHTIDILTADLSRKQILPILGIHFSRKMCKLIWDQIGAGYHILSDPKHQSNEQYKAQIVSQMEEKARRVDFMMTYYTLNCLLVDNFTQSEYFVKNSGLHIIMNNKPLKMELQHFAIIQEKLKTLEII